MSHINAVYKFALVTVLLMIASAACKKKVASIAPPPAIRSAEDASSITGPTAPPTVQIGAEPSVVERGASFTLSWDSTGAESLIIDHGVGTVSTSGSSQITPEQSTTYTATATNPAGSTSASARVTVTAPPTTPPPTDTDRMSIEDIIRQGLIKAVFFDFDQYSLTSEARETLVQNTSQMRRYPEVTFILEGHCDERGTSEYNIALGDRRARAVMSYLVSLGMSESRLETISYGKERPFAEGHDEASWALNRRVQFALRR